jgi:Ubiquitin-like modifier-activating enzyme ATG7 N-terminus
VYDPNLLIRFVLLTFADLKNYKFTYWFGCPALLPATPFVSQPAIALSQVHTLTLAHKPEQNHSSTYEDEGVNDRITSEQQQGQCNGCGLVTLYRGLAQCEGLWGRRQSDTSTDLAALASLSCSDSGVKTNEKSSPIPPVFCLIGTTITPKAPLQADTQEQQGDYTWRVQSLAAAWGSRYCQSPTGDICAGSGDGMSTDRGGADTDGSHRRGAQVTYIIIADTGSNNKGNDSPVPVFGWQMRNVLALLGAHTGETTRRVNVIALRGPLAKRLYACSSAEQISEVLRSHSDDQILAADESLLLHVLLPASGFSVSLPVTTTYSTTSSTIPSSSSSSNNDTINNASASASASCGRLGAERAR